MDIKEAYEKIAGVLDLKPEQVEWLIELTLDQTIINPILPATATGLGRIMDLRPGKKVLDLACGKAGMSLPLVYTYKVKLTGVDLVPDFIREAWSRAEYTGLFEYCSFRNMDAAEFAAKAQGRWDVVMVVGAMPYLWPDLEDGLGRLKPLVEPGGFLVIGQPYRLGDEGEDLLTREETEALMKKQGEVVSVLDDGRAGWEAMWAPQKKAIDRLRSEKPDQADLLEFLDQWEKQTLWEMDNIGFALWVIKVD